MSPFYLHLKENTITDQYDIVSDVKNRINLRHSKSKYFHVKVLSNGCYFLEPRILVAPLSISSETLKTIDHSVASLKRKKASSPIDLKAFEK